MSTTTVIHVEIESEPHDQDLSSVLLNRPAPNGGAFLVGRRLDRAIWDQMKAAGARYLSAEDLEDFDMFDAAPGWRYSLDAIVVLIRHGYTLDLRGETVTTEEQLRGLFTTEAKATYRARIQAEREQAERTRQEAARRTEEDRAVRGASYAIWQQLFLAGLTSTSIGPDSSAGVYGAGGPWVIVYNAPKGTPGAWYDTGDRWCQNPAGVLRRDYGNASVWFASQETVDSWVLACDSGSAAYARHVLEYHGYGVHGSDVADRLVELRGLDHYLERARSEEWLIKAGSSISREVDVIAHYGIAATPIQIADRPYAFTQQLQELLGYKRSDRGAPRGVGQAPDGRWFSTPDIFNGGGWRLLTAEECAALGLDMTPPAQAPALPPARPLPTREETEARSRMFSDIFSG